MKVLNLKIDWNLFNLDVEFETEINADIYEKFMKDFWYWFMLAASHPDEEKRTKHIFMMINALMNWESPLRDEAKNGVTVTEIIS